MASAVRRVIALQVLELLIFAVLAAVVLYQLYAVLGRKVGRQPEEKAAAGASRTAVDAQIAQRLPADSPARGGRAAIIDYGILQIKRQRLTFLQSIT